jgi:AmpD protein
MHFKELEQLSPNRGPAVHERLGTLFHHSVMGFRETLEWMGRPESQVSYHGLIDLDGTRCTLVPDAEIAWHAGASHFLGRERCNDFMLGLAFAGDTYAAPITDAQLASALEWLQARWMPLGWSMGRITDHRQASPGRKLDLNPTEWDRLSAAIFCKFAQATPPDCVSGLKSQALGRT